MKNLFCASRQRDQYSKLTMSFNSIRPWDKLYKLNNREAQNSIIKHVTNEQVPVVVKR